MRCTMFKKKMKVIYMSLSKWKELAESKAKAGKAKNQLCDQITAEGIKSKTSDAAITTSFRLDEIKEGLKGKPQKRDRDYVRLKEKMEALIMHLK